MELDVLLSLEWLKKKIGTARQEMSYIALSLLFADVWRRQGTVPDSCSYRGAIGISEA
jgi:hypothetical protein